MRSIGEGLGQLAQRHVAVWHQHQSRQAGPRGIGRGSGAGVAGGRTDHGAGAVLDRPGHGEHHATVLERAGGVAPFTLEIHGVQTGVPLQRRRTHQGRRPFAQRERGRAGGQGQQVAIARQHAARPTRRGDHTHSSPGL